MSEQLQLRSGTAAQVAAFTGAQAECAVDTTNNRIVIQDGSTAGGWPAAKLTEVITNTRTAVSDAAYTALTTDRLIAYTALTAPRTVTLPAASSYPTGTRLLIVDESGDASTATPISVTPHGTDLINNSSSTFLIASVRGALELESNGSSAWTIINNGTTASTVLAQGVNGTQALYQLLQHASGTLPSSTTYTWSGAVPNNVLVLAVSCRVETAITGASSISIGWNGSGGGTATFGSCGVSAGSTSVGVIGPTGNYVGPSNITVTGNASFTGGAVTLAVHYMTFTPPTS